MRFLALAAISTACLASLTYVAPAARASGLQFGHPPPGLPDLGPAGNGRRLFVELNCTLCHGGHAAGGTGPNIQQADPGDVNEAVKQGIPEAGMPSFGKYVTAKNLSDLAAYLKTAGTPKEPTWWDWWVPHPKI